MPVLVLLVCLSAGNVYQLMPFWKAPFSPTTVDQAGGQRRRVHHTGIRGSGGGWSHCWRCWRCWRCWDRGPAGSRHSAGHRTGAGWQTGDHCQGNGWIQRYWNGSEAGGRRNGYPLVRRCSMRWTQDWRGAGWPDTGRHRSSSGSGRRSACRSSGCGWCCCCRWSQPGCWRLCRWRSCSGSWGTPRSHQPEERSRRPGPAGAGRAERVKTKWRRIKNNGLIVAKEMALVADICIPISWKWSCFSHLQ